MRLILTEKPSVASEFARALKAEKHIGYYENRDTIITYCFGHLLRLCNPEEYNPDYKKWTIESLPISPLHYRYVELPEAKRQLTIIKDLVIRVCKTPHNIIIATDAGREGELIARETLQYCGKNDLTNVYRFWTSEALTSEVIERNLHEIKPADKYTPLYFSAYHRMLSDWLVGMNLTRYFSVKLNDIFAFGRVQIPVLAAIVSRTETIRAFKPSPFYYLRITLSKDGSPFFAYYTRNGAIRFNSRDPLEPIIQEIQKLRPKAKAVSTQKEQKSIAAPQLYNLTALQKAANKHYGYKASYTAEIAQSLYETHKILSYPRTSSRVLAKSNHRLFCNTVTSLNFHYPEIFRGFTLPSSDNTRIFDDSKLSDHHALLILDKLPLNLTQDEHNIAMLVMKSMAALMLSPYVYVTQIINIDVCGKTYQSRGKQVITPGWKQLYTSEKELTEENEAPEEETNFEKTLPPIAEGDIFDIFMRIFSSIRLALLPLLPNPLYWE